LQCGDELSEELWWTSNALSNLYSKLKMTTSCEIHWWFIQIHGTVCQMTIYFLGMISNQSYRTHLVLVKAIKFRVNTFVTTNQF
jgi:hypothetical protein